MRIFNKDVSRGIKDKQSVRPLITLIKFAIQTSREVHVAEPDVLRNLLTIVKAFQ